MNTPLYLVARMLAGLIQALPLEAAARLGRAGGWLAYHLDRRHRKVALRNLTMCFGKEKSDAEIRSIARENFLRIGENFVSAVKTASMSLDELEPHLEFGGVPHDFASSGGAPVGIVAAIGHFGNFELYARLGGHFPLHRFATTYRGLRQASANTLMQALREQSGCKFFERRFDAGPLKEFMHAPGPMLGLLADQHAGKNGLRLPFLSHDCSTSPAPAVFALRYHCKLFPGICYRVGLAKWRVEAGPEIPTMADGHSRTTTEIMSDVNRAFDEAVRRDPANWFWVHNRWKPL
jgi:KDO2-lipid IV(A) lauroyltransferase